MSQTLFVNIRKLFQYQKQHLDKWISRQAVASPAYVTRRASGKNTITGNNMSIDSDYTNTNCDKAIKTAGKGKRKESKELRWLQTMLLALISAIKIAQPKC